MVKIEHTARYNGGVDMDTQHPWPDDTFVQGGARGVVFVAGGPNYETAFVEAFPANTFLRGEGATIGEAETAAWGKYQRILACPTMVGPYTNPVTGEEGVMVGPLHGDRDNDWDRRGYTNGSAFCPHCGTWFPRVVDPLPPDPDAPKSGIEQLADAVIAASPERQRAAVRAGLDDDPAGFVAAITGEERP